MRDEVRKWGVGVAGTGNLAFIVDLRFDETNHSNWGALSCGMDAIYTKLSTYYQTHFYLYEAQGLPMRLVRCSECHHWSNGSERTVSRVVAAVAGTYLKHAGQVLNFSTGNINVGVLVEEHMRSADLSPA